MGTTDTGEFAYLAEEAAELGLPAPLPPVRRATVPEGDERSISALVWGSRSPRLAFLHGVGLNAHTFDGTVMALAAAGVDGAVALDLPGHGDSSWRPDVDYSPLTLAEPVTQALTALAPDGRLLVVGQSLGGLTALVLAARHPELVAGLVVVDISPGLHQVDAAQVRDFLAGPTSFDSREEIVERALAFGIGASRRPLERGVALNTRIGPDGTVVFKHHLANLGGALPADSDLASVWPSAESLQVPVVLVRASAGYLTDDVVAEFLDRVPGSTLRTVTAGHNVQEQAPAELAQIISEALS